MYCLQCDIPVSTMYDKVGRDRGSSHHDGLQIDVAPGDGADNACHDTRLFHNAFPDDGNDGNVTDGSCFRNCADGHGIEASMRLAEITF